MESESYIGLVIMGALIVTMVITLIVDEIKKK
jgi:hydroxyacyl-ACP dehydratase HTD2-like protein with hotdog domain